jgi:hypothetical protein
MTVTIEPPPEVEATPAAQAQAEGLPLSLCAPVLSDEAISRESLYPNRD